MMDWDRITQTGARTPGVRAVSGPNLWCQRWATFPDSELVRKGGPADTKGGDRLAVYARTLGASLSALAARQVPSDAHIFQPY
jgi:hypothetical protein